MLKVRKSKSFGRIGSPQLPLGSTQSPATQVTHARRESAQFCCQTLKAALRDFYFTYENDPRGSGYLGLELRVWVCGARGAEVVVGSGVVATAICHM